MALTIPPTPCKRAAKHLTWHQATRLNALPNTVPSHSAADPIRGLEDAARPLLHLARQITGLESTFLSAIDWENQTQEVLFSSNSDRLQFDEGSVVDWEASLCRKMFLTGRTASHDFGAMVARTPEGRARQIKTFVSVPILVGDTAIGTVCGASEKSIELGKSQVEGLRLISDALRHLLELERERHAALSRAKRAETAARLARIETRHHATEFELMQRLANTDALTGLSNRRAFMSRWEHELARSGRRQYPISLILVDADHFKTVNDSMGHELGDAVLRAIGATLLLIVKSPDFVARLGGDEFAFVTTHHDHDYLLAVSAKLQQLFALVAAELGVATTLSIGMACSLECPREQLFVEADRALYRSKNAGGNTARLYEGADHASSGYGSEYAQAGANP